MSPTTTTPAALPLAADAERLPDDPALLKAMLAELLRALRDSRREGEQLRARLDALLRRLFGPRAERLDPGQLLLFAEMPTEPAPPPPATESPPMTNGRPARPGHGRAPLPRHLPRDRRVHELSAAERACPCCGQPRRVIGQEVSEQLDYVPASLRVIEHVRLTYACAGCSALSAAAAGRAPADGEAPPTIATAAKPPPPIAKGLPGAGLLAHVIVSKYGDHLPLYRLEHIFARQGVPLARSTLCAWLPACAELLRPLYEVLRQRVLQAWTIQTDDTPVPVQDATRGRTRPGRVWVYWGDATQPYVVYAYTPTREQAGPQGFLADYLGYLQADAYSGYDVLYATGRISEVGCWAHARRKFYEAQATDPERALWVLGVIRQLYRVEKEADDEIARRCLPLQQGWWLRLRLRQEQAVPLLTRLCQWLREQQGQVLPKSPIGEAIGYALNQWAALWRYVTQGYLQIDNNAAERALRAIAVGRKNYLFFGSDAGGETAAVLYTFVQSCKRLAIEPWRYLRDLLERLPSWPGERLEEMLPDRWAEAQRQAATGPPAREATAGA